MSEHNFCVAQKGKQYKPNTKFEDELAEDDILMKSVPFALNKK